MLENQITLVWGGPVSVSDTDNGRTVRRRNLGHGEFQELVIARQESMENKPVITDRYLIQRNLLSTNVGEREKAIRGSVAMTFAYPRQLFVNETLQSMCLDIVSLLCGTISATNISNMNATLDRIFNGES